MVLTAIAFIAASFIPMLGSSPGRPLGGSTKREPFGPFTPAAETLNGRAAMIGFAALLALEAARGGTAFF